MGASPSKPTHHGYCSDVRRYCPPRMTDEMRQVLHNNTYKPGNNAKYPYFLVQLSEEGELPCGKNDDIYMSDCIAAWLTENPVTHIIAQTHGWNTPPDKAVAVPFTEFMGGMQNDAAMPCEDFKPVWVAFIWPAVPFFAPKEEDALTRTELIIKSEKENCKSGKTDICLAAEAAKKAIQKGDPKDKEFHSKMVALCQNTVDDDDDDDDTDDEDVRNVKEGKPEAVVQRAEDTFAGHFIEGALSVFRPFLRPFENLAFARLMKRGRKTGEFMGAVLCKMMRSVEGRPRVSIMANSLGAHMIVGVLKKAADMPYKIHTVFFVQGAISRKWFSTGGRYSHLVEEVAGPVVATYSDRDYMLRNIFGPFHGEALGFDGFPIGSEIEMKGLKEVQKCPYNFDCSVFNSVNASNFIDEGDAFAGAHSDFKEDETTTLYWNMITCDMRKSAYNRNSK